MCSPTGIITIKIKLITDPFNSIRVSALKLVNLTIKQIKMTIPVKMTYLKDTSSVSTYSRILKNRFLHYSTKILGY